LPLTTRQPRIIVEVPPERKILWPYSVCLLRKMEK